MTKTIALALALVAGTVTLASAQEADPNLLNRYPTFNGAYGVGDSAEVVAPRAFQSAPVRLNEGGTSYVAQRAPASRPQPQTFHYDSAPLISGGGY